MKSSQSTLRLTANIVQGSLLYSDPDYRKKLKEFKAVNEGFSCDVIFESHDNVRYWQHKYYRGFILPIIAEAQGEKDIDYLHEFILKERFLRFKVEDWRDIPSRHRAGCRLMMKDDKVIYYVPSCAVLNYKEMREFILNTEAIRDGLIEWEYKDPQEAVRIRKLAFQGDEK